MRPPHQRRPPPDYRITEPALRPIRRWMPSLGGIDISPLVLIIGIIFLRSLLIEYWPR